MTVIYLLDGRPVDLDTFTREYVARGKPADLTRTLARIADRQRREPRSA